MWHILDFLIGSLFPTRWVVHGLKISFPSPTYCNMYRNGLINLFSMSPSIACNPPASNTLGIKFVVSVSLKLFMLRGVICSAPVQLVLYSAKSSRVVCMPCLLHLHMRRDEYLIYRAPIELTFRLSCRFMARNSPLSKASKPTVASKTGHGK